MPTADYAARRFAGTGRVVGGALGPLLDIAAGHPQRTMLLAHALWDANPAGSTAAADAVAVAVDRVTVELPGEFSGIWSSLPAGQRRILGLVAEGRERPVFADIVGGRVEGAAVHSGLRALVQRGENVGDRARRPGYRVVDPLLAAWVRDGRPGSPG